MSTEIPHTDTEVGFCAKCGIFREDHITQEGKRIPVTDCGCTSVAYGHTKECTYTKVASCPIDVGIYCEAHDRSPCETCECDCGKVLSEEVGEGNE